MCHYRKFHDEMFGIGDDIFRWLCVAVTLRHLGCGDSFLKPDLFELKLILDAQSAWLMRLKIFSADCKAHVYVRCICYEGSL